MTPRRSQQTINHARLLGSRIRERRKALGLTQAEVSSQIGISYQAMQKIESGETSSTTPRIEEIAMILKTSVAALLAFTPDLTDEAMEFAVTIEGRKVLQSFNSIQDQLVRDQLIRMMQVLGNTRGAAVNGDWKSASG